MHFESLFRGRALKLAILQISVDGGRRKTERRRGAASLRTVDDYTSSAGSTVVDIRSPYERRTVSHMSF